MEDLSNLDYNSLLKLAMKYREALKKISCEDMAGLAPDECKWMIERANKALALTRKDLEGE